MTEQELDFDTDVEDVDLQSDNQDDIEEAIDTCDRVIEMAEDRMSGRVYSEETEKYRIRWAKVISTMLRTKRKWLEDRELADMREKLESLEQAERERRW